MSGVFGVIDPHQKVDRVNLMGRMAAAMSHREWYVADTHVDEVSPAALGRLGIGIFNTNPQPVWNAAHTIALMMAGEFYEVRTDDPEVTCPPDEVLALSLYEKHGEDFIYRVKGAFVIAIWDAEANSLLLFNDRFGLYPLYYACHQGRLVFAPEVKGVLCDPGFSRKLDVTALAQYMRFQHLLGVRTFFEGVRLLPDASILRFELSTGNLQVKSYWGFEEIPEAPNMSFDDAVDEAGRLFRRAVHRLSSDRYRPGVFLSGGLDSRTILGMVARRPIDTFTFGVKNSRDVYYASKIAKAERSQHHYFNFPNGDWIKENVDFHLDLTEGFHSWIHMHGIHMLPEVRQAIEVNLTGWEGGAIFSHIGDADPLLYNAVSDEAFITHLFQRYNQSYTWPSITEAEERLLYCSPLREIIPCLAYDSFREELTPYLDLRKELRHKGFFIRNNSGRLTRHMVTISRSHIEVRFPFFDYDVFDFLFSLPIEYRARNRLYTAMIQAEMPELAYIPDDYDEFLPTTHKFLRMGQTTIVKVKRRINRHMGRIFPERTTLYADYENYLREELRDWAEEILYDRRTVERGIFNPTFVRTLMGRHLSGKEQWTIGKIAPIITYEMMLRCLYD